MNYFNSEYTNIHYPVSRIEKQPILKVYRKVQDIDLGPISYKLTKSSEGPMWEYSKVLSLIELYRKFLALAGAYPELPIVPTKDIDEVWHTHILDTAKYRSDCNYMFDSFLDHFPYLGTRGKEDEERLFSAFEVTKSLFQKHFNIDPTLVIESKDCGTGTCGAECAQTCGCNTGKERGIVEILRPTL